MVGLPSLYEKILPDFLQQNKKMLKLFSGVSIALIETTILCPAERVKVYFMTLDQKKTYRGFFQSIRGNTRKELFRGFTPLLARQCMNWTVFLQTDLLVKSYIRYRLELKDSETIPARYLFPASVVVAAANTTIVNPFDCVKTHMEKVNPMSTYTGAVGTIYR